jgi:DNA-binding MarR family transcriptional regulator
MDGDLGWALGMVFRRYLKAAKQAAVDLPGGPRGYQVLRSAAGDTPSTQLAIAEQLGVDRTVMTYLLDELEGAGLVERRPDPADRRARQVLLTETGRGRLCDLERRLRDAEDHLLAPLEPEERDVLRRLLQRLATDTDGASPCQVAADIQAVETGGAC